jgi:rSAM/selenodomain-associated transferase 2
MKISIIIPTYNEEKNIINLLVNLKSQLKTYPKSEILIIDGGSSDRTLNLVKEIGITAYSCQKGRGEQLHLGATNSTGDVLYFLHADSIPPKNFLSIIESEVTSGSEVGCFQLIFSPTNRILKFYEYFVRFPLIVFRGGDQSLFITKNLYKKVGGFNSSFKLMEDIDFIKRVVKESKFKILKEKVMTSSQKYKTNGTVKLQFLFAIMHFFFFIGLSNKQIKKFYDKIVK